MRMYSENLHKLFCNRHFAKVSVLKGLFASSMDSKRCDEGIDSIGARVSNELISNEAMDVTVLIREETPLADAIRLLNKMIDLLETYPAAVDPKTLADKFVTRTGNGRVEVSSRDSNFPVIRDESDVSTSI